MAQIAERKQAVEKAVEAYTKLEVPCLLTSSSSFLLSGLELQPSMSLSYEPFSEPLIILKSVKFI